MIGILIVAAFLAFAILGALYVERFRQRPPVTRRTPRIVLDKRKRRGIAPYAFYLSGLRRNQLWARVTLHNEDRATQADRLAADLRAMLAAAGFHKELSDMTSVPARRLNRMVLLLADDPAFAGACARGLGLLVAGLQCLEGLEDDILLPNSQYIDALVTNLMDTAIQSLGEEASSQE